MMKHEKIRIEKLQKLKEKKELILSRKTKIKERKTPLGELRSNHTSNIVRNNLTVEADTIHITNNKIQKEDTKQEVDSIMRTLDRINNKKNKMQKVIKKNNRKHKVTILEDIFNNYVFFTTEYGFQLYPTKQRVDTYLVGIYNKKYELFKQALDYIFNVAENINDYEVIITPSTEGGINNLASIIKKRALEGRVLSRVEYLDRNSKYGKSFMYIKVIPKDNTKPSRIFSINDSYVFFDDPNKDRSKTCEVYKNIDMSRRDTFGINYALRETLFKDYIINSFYDAIMNMHQVLSKN